ncbi:MarR family winged helix-turn-helix transcriptional regulator [Faecalibacter rhinopitheci]|uniref:Winged helix DNA-binding protein n=1 Tax=Faecalibacter rhinopitheci TaxID=2779678 RepID=A0A8J7G8J6_9FLAO|nr:MarR family winged helix-turn-helix transcriptional regulator [Faecalibacter rhinopitheci]MBF0597305.1 winged helix DNA-binding protein [Faecalibacter rhinopitheci]
MKYKLLKDILINLEEFEEFCDENDEQIRDFDAYKSWLINDQSHRDLTWEGKDKGRSLNSIINTLIVHLNRYAKSYSKSVIYNTKFVSQEDFIYLINLRALGPMTKIELIKKNIHEKSPGMQIINRLIANKWIIQVDDVIDRRSKLISITEEGEKMLDENMDKIRNATNIVTGNLSDEEKLKLISLLQKLENYHYPIYNENKKPEELLEYVKNINTKRDAN